MEIILIYLAHNLKLVKIPHNILCVGMDSENIDGLNLCTIVIVEVKNLVTILNRIPEILMSVIGVIISSGLWEMHLKLFIAIMKIGTNKNK
jgi:hypothetical protein